MASTIFDGLEAPPAAKLLGWKLLALDIEAGTIEVEFDGKTAFVNSTGYIQGGFLAAMLDDTLGPITFAMTEGKTLGRTIDLHIHYLKPALPGRIVGLGKITQLGRRIAYLEGHLNDQDGNVVARATSSAMMFGYKHGNTST